MTPARLNLDMQLRIRRRLLELIDADLCASVLLTVSVHQ